jgi:hypothetical protein
MSFITRNLNQNITIWTAGATDVYGTPTWSSPTTIKGRWEDKQIKTVDYQGNDIISNAIVYTEIDIALGDYVYLGISADTTPPTSAREVRNYSKIPDLKNKMYLRKIIL